MKFIPGWAYIAPLELAMEISIAYKNYFKADLANQPQHCGSCLDMSPMTKGDAWVFHYVSEYCVSKTLLRNCIDKFTSQNLLLVEFPLVAANGLFIIAIPINRYSHS
jgi:hypothetical protein